VTAIAFIGFGAVAGHLAPELSRHGTKVTSYDLAFSQLDGIDTLKQRIGAAGVEFLSLQDVVDRSNILLSVVTTEAALDAVKACAGLLRNHHIYVDLNATSPAIKRSMANILEASGGHFVEGAILNAIDVAGVRARILVCGGKAKIVADTLTRLGLNVAFYGTEIGRASTFKLLRSVFSKGMEALLLETLLTAGRAGIKDEVWSEILTTLDEQSFKDVGANWMRTHGTAHARRYHEMMQVRELVSQLGVEPIMTQATAAFFERSTRLALSKTFPDGPLNHDEVLEALDRLFFEHTRERNAEENSACG
jgi:3-hydroxyisobutyrate dehydrogenase-like beta-hydroxyacid dehydrogenase